MTLSAKSQGRLIVFEGVDAAGKSAIAKQVKSKLDAQRVSAQLLSFPGKTPHTLGDLVYRLHHTPQDCGVSKLSAASLQALHIAAHLDTIETTIIPSLEAGVSILLDRYWWSTLAYGLVDGVKPAILHSLIEAEKQAWGNWRPHCLFYVRRANPLRPESHEKLTRLRAAYESVAKSEFGNYPITMIENETTLDEATDAAISFLSQAKR